MNAKVILEKNSHGTTKGIVIGKHLEQIDAMPCMSCASPDTYLIWSENYSGYRGICDICESNWPES